MVEIGVIGGDGIGPEVVPAGMRVLEGVASDDPSLELGFTEFPWGCEYYLWAAHNDLLSLGRSSPANSREP
jgi:tartrate dehydrogenase/decarboxylase / D-malate dehydrogenase